MKRMIAVAVISIFVGIGPSFAQGDGKETDLQQLQGTWQIRELQLEVPGSTKPPQAELEKCRWIITGNKLTWVYPDQKKMSQESFTLHPQRKPKWIDVTSTVQIEFTDGPKKNGPTTEKWTLYGIYHLEGKTLRVCLPIQPTGSNSRPVDITAKSGSGCLVWILERVDKKNKLTPSR